MTESYKKLSPQDKVQGSFDVLVDIKKNLPSPRAMLIYLLISLLLTAGIIAGTSFGPSWLIWAVSPVILVASLPLLLLVLGVTQLVAVIVLLVLLIFWFSTAVILTWFHDTFVAR
jgi:hypothetical protein